MNKRLKRNFKMENIQMWPIKEYIKSSRTCKLKITMRDHFISGRMANIGKTNSIHVRRKWSTWNAHPMLAGV